MLLFFLLVSVPGCVDLTSAKIYPGYDSIKLVWSLPTEPNGIITKYTVNWNGSIANTTEPEIWLKDLAAITLYTVTVVAHTVKGEGDKCDTSTISESTKIGREFQNILLQGQIVNVPRVCYKT